MQQILYGREGVLATFICDQPKIMKKKRRALASDAAEKIDILELKLAVHSLGPVHDHRSILLMAATLSS